MVYYNIIWCALEHVIIMLKTCPENRREFFDKWLAKLRREASHGYDALATSCSELQSLISHYPEVPFLKNISKLNSQIEDNHSKAFLPGSCKHLTPLTTTADGNCLYRYVVYTIL